jgi:hypothetical protein
MSSYAKLSLQQKMNQASYLKRWRQARKKPFISILDKDILPPKKIYTKRLKSESESDETENAGENDCKNAGENDGENDCENDGENDCESDDDMITTIYRKSPELKALDASLKDKLNRMGFDTTEKVANVFQIFLHVNAKYGIPAMEHRNPKRLEEFYSTAILNLG